MGAVGKRRHAREAIEPLGENDSQPDTDALAPFAAFASLAFSTGGFALIARAPCAWMSVFLDAANLPGVGEDIDSDVGGSGGCAKQHGELISAPRK